MKIIRTRPPVSIRLPLAEAVQEPGTPAWVLTQRNDRGLSVALRVGVEQDSPVMVRVARDMLAVDFDHGSTVGGPDQAAQAVFLRLRRQGLLPVLIASGQPGRRHLFCRITDVATRKAAKEHAKQLKGDVREWIRPPLSAHRLGLPVSLLLPTTPEEALRRLLCDGRAVVREATQERLNLTEIDGLDASQVLYSIAMGLANVGWEEAEFLMLVSTPGNAAHDLYERRVERRNRADTEVWIQRVWAAALTKVHENPSHPQAEHLDRLLWWCENRRWGGRTGPSQRAVFLALVQKYQRCGATPFNASQRELAQLAGLTRDPVQKALTVLQRNGIIKKHPTTGGRTAQGLGVSDSWEFLSPLGGAHPPSRPSQAPLDRLAHDAFRGRGLNKTTQYVYDLIDESRLRLKDLVDTTGLTKRTVSAHLRRLQKLGLASVTDGRWASTEQDLDGVATMLGTAGAAEEQRKLYEHERDRHGERSQSSSMRTVQQAQGDPPNQK